MKMVCPFCGLGGTARKDLFQSNVRCPKCEQVFTVTDDVLAEKSGAEVTGHIAGSGGLSGAGMGIGKLKTCSNCGFNLSGEFIKVIENRPVCAVCAG